MIKIAAKRCKSSQNHQRQRFW